MKWGGTSLACGGEESPSTRREWIEIQLLALYQQLEESPSTRREWIEIVPSQGTQGGGGSPSTRREWIEMQHISAQSGAMCVSLHTEGVD